MTFGRFYQEYRERMIDECPAIGAAYLVLKIKRIGETFKSDAELALDRRRVYDYYRAVERESDADFDHTAEECPREMYGGSDTIDGYEDWDYSDCGYATSDPKHPTYGDSDFH